MTTVACTLLICFTVIFSINMVLKFLARELNLLKNILENHAKSTNTNISSSQRSIESKQTSEDLPRQKVETSITEEDLSSIVSKGSRTAVSFGEDVSD